MTLLGSGVVTRSVAHQPANRAEAFSYTARSSGTATSVGLYVESRAGTARLRVAVYSNRRGRPGVLLTSGSRLRPRARAWTRIAVHAASLTTGHQYWLVVLPTGGKVALRLSADRGLCRRGSAPPSDDGLPKTLGIALGPAGVPGVRVRDRRVRRSAPHRWQRIDSAGAPGAPEPTFGSRSADQELLQHPERVRLPRPDEHRRPGWYATHDLQRRSADQRAGNVLRLERRQRVDQGQRQQRHDQGQRGHQLAIPPATTYSSLRE